MADNFWTDLGGAWAERVDIRPLLGLMESEGLGGTLKALTRGAYEGAESEYVKMIQEFQKPRPSIPTAMFRGLTGTVPLLGPAVGEAIPTQDELLEQNISGGELAGRILSIPADPAILATGGAAVAAKGVPGALRGALRGPRYVHRVLDEPISIKGAEVPVQRGAPVSLVDEAGNEISNVRGPEVSELLDPSGSPIAKPKTEPGLLLDNEIEVMRPTRVKGVASDKYGDLVELDDGTTFRLTEGSDVPEVGTKFKGRGYIDNPAKGPIEISGGPGPGFRAYRSALESVEAIPFVGKKLGGSLRDYVQAAEKRAGQLISHRRRISAGLSKSDDRAIVDVLDGKRDISELAEPLQNKTIQLRALMNQVADEADATKVLTGYRESYFPHKFKDGEWEHKVAASLESPRNKKFGHLEKRRTEDRADYVRKLDVLDEYFADSARRISEAKYLGKDLSKVLNPNIRMTQRTRQALEKTVERLTGREESTAVSRFLSEARHATALGALSRAGAYQLGALAQNVTAGGMRRAVRATMKMARNLKGAELDAVRSGSLFPSVTGEIAATAGAKHSFVSRLTRGYLHGIPTIDKWMRVQANEIGKVLYQDALSGNKGALRELRRLGIEDVKATSADDVGKLVSDKANYRTGTLDLPIWATSTPGKVLTQFNSFMYRHARYVTDELIGNAVKGDVKPLMRFLASGLVAGEIVADIRALMYGNKLAEDIPDKAKAFFSSKRASDPAVRAIQNLAMVGGMGVWQSLVESASRWNFPENLLLGPVGTDAAKLGRVGKSLAVDKDELPLLRLGAEKVPFVGGRLKRELPSGRRRGSRKSASEFRKDLIRRIRNRNRS